MKTLLITILTILSLRLSGQVLENHMDIRTDTIQPVIEFYDMLNQSGYLIIERPFVAPLFPMFGTYFLVNYMDNRGYTPEQKFFTSVTGMAVTTVVFMIDRRIKNRRHKPYKPY